MARAAKVCGHPTCPNIEPCALHRTLPWAGSTRRTRTISGSRQQKRARYVLRRDMALCHVCGRHGATEADHVVPLAEGGMDTISNMKAIHYDCHNLKTQQDAKRGRAA